jgi:hypothetical protein
MEPIRRRRIIAAKTSWIILKELVLKSKFMEPHESNAKALLDKKRYKQFESGKTPQLYDLKVKN